MFYSLIDSVGGWVNAPTRMKGMRKSNPLEWEFNIAPGYA
jgi:hypothetical protein